MRRIKHYLEYFGVWLLLQLMLLLGLHISRKIGHLLGAFAFSVVRVRRNVTIENLSLAFPDKTAKEIYQLGRKTYAHFSCMLFECLLLTKMSGQSLTHFFKSITNSHLLNQARLQGHGAIVMPGHLGNWEYLGAWLSVSGYPLTSLIRKQRNPHINALICGYRERMGMTLIPRGMALRGYMRALKKGKFVAILADQDAGSNGIFIPFMGRPASTATGPARFSIKAKAPIIFGICYRDKQDELHLAFEELKVDTEGLDNDAAVKKITMAHTQKLEQWVRKYPHQWLWMHKRWKTKPPDASKNQSTL